MLPEAGTFALILALCLALMQLAAVWRIFPATLAKFTAVGQLFFLSISMLCLMITLVQCDYSVVYVLEHSHPTMPFWYRIGAAWGGHEGSLLLWCLMLSGWTAVFAWIGRQKLTISFHTRVLSVMGFTNAGFLIFLLLTSNPFWRVFSLTPLQGQDLTAVLQDPGLIFHPPMLYSGYVGFVTAFAFAVALLLSKKPDPQWARTLRPWVALPWALLGCGIVLGSWWSYRELGWGGWWFWDPVENASLMPWLTATALLHSLIVTQKRLGFAGWSIFLALLTFALSLLGTFLVRSGVLVSVHAFAADPSRGVFLLGWLALLTGGSFLLYAFRISRFAQAVQFGLWSRETLMLTGTIALLSGAVILLTGTLYPIVLDALNAGKISVGEPYFTALFTPLFLGILLLIAIVPHVPWGKSGDASSFSTWVPAVTGGLLTVFLLSWTMQRVPHLLTILGLFAAGAILGITAQQLLQKKNHTIKSLPMLLAHAGVAIMTLGITVNQSWSEAHQLRVYPRDTFDFAGFTFQFEKVTTSEGPNYSRFSAHFRVRENNYNRGCISVHQQTYAAHHENFPRPGILPSLWHDLYIAPGSVYTDGSWAIRLYYRPFVRWIWAGGFMIMAGGLLSLLLQRRRPPL